MGEAPKVGHTKGHMEQLKAVYLEVSLEQKASGKSGLV